MDTKSSCPVFEAFLVELVPDPEKREKLVKELRTQVEDIVRGQLRREL